MTPLPRTASTLLGLLALLPLASAAGCSGGGATSESATATTTTGATTGGATGTGTAATEATSAGETTGLIPVPPACEDDPAPGCADPIKDCKEDQDKDGVPFGCDNAPRHTNPGQVDGDGDGFGDVADLCPTVASAVNTADSDKDGVGNDCDVCRLGAFKYNQNADAVPFYMRVRNIPAQTDADHDGIGDVCDNCIHTPNCQGYGEGGQGPYVVGDAIDPEAADCQVDADLDHIGDACVGQTLPGAAGPVGFGDADDFDQDGLANKGDRCPRQPVARVECSGDGECPAGASCAAEGICNHTDRDGDGVGDICDTCPDAANPQQIVEGAGDDADGDFIGDACELHAACEVRANPRPFAFYDVSVDGRCCVTSYDGAPIFDPDGVPIDVGGLDHPPGVFDLPPGCAEALSASEDGVAHAIRPCHVDALADLWPYLCFLPPLDHEYDGVPDECDLCPFVFDPAQEIYVDDNMKEWPDSGRYCNGAYSLSLLDPAKMCMMP